MLPFPVTVSDLQGHFRYLETFITLIAGKNIDYYTNKIYGSNFTKQHSETVMVWNYQNAGGSLRKNIASFIIIFGTFSFHFQVCSGVSKRTSYFYPELPFPLADCKRSSIKPAAFDVISSLETAIGVRPHKRHDEAKKNYKTECLEFILPHVVGLLERIWGL